MPLHVAGPPHPLGGLCCPHSAVHGRIGPSTMTGMAHLTSIAPPMSSTLSAAPNRLWIWQQNLNKSRIAQEDLINSDVYKNYDLLILQEPFIDSYGKMKATSDWRVVYPTSLLSHTHPTHSVMLVRVSLDMNRWAQLSIPDSGDLVAIQISSRQGRVSIFGIYVDCHHSTALNILDGFLSAHRNTISTRTSNHTFWCGDFNCHHPLWDKDHNKELFM